MKNLNYELLTLCRRNRDGSYGTRSRRWETLNHVANQLHQLGYREMNIRSLKGKHILALVDLWKKEGNLPSTMQNKLAHVRWWAEKVNRSHVIHPKNSFYGIPGRSSKYVNKAQELSEFQFLEIKDEYVRTSVRMQQAFGLRREESMKFSPSYAIKSDRIELKGTWTKGGRPRSIPILLQQQRELLDYVSNLVGNGSLIPPHLSYYTHMRRYDNQVSKAGLNNLHGLRHGYAQRRYIALTGWTPPAMGGLTFKELTPEQQIVDQESRLIVSRELGHNRISITSVYLG